MVSVSFGVTGSLWTGVSQTPDIQSNIRLSNEYVCYYPVQFLVRDFKTVQKEMLAYYPGSLVKGQEG